MTHNSQQPPRLFSTLLSITLIFGTDAWQEHRKRRNLALVAFFGYMPIVFLIGMAI